MIKVGENKKNMENNNVKKIINKKFLIMGNMKDVYINDICVKLLNWYSIQYYFFAYPNCQ